MPPVIYTAGRVSPHSHPYHYRVAISMAVDIALRQALISDSGEYNSA